jgi:hypothetical protein
MKKVLTGIKSTLNWSYPRGSWQYDLLCALIIAIIFLVPSRFFGDRDRSKAPPAQLRQLEIDPVDLQDFLQRRQRSDLRNFPSRALGFYLQEQYNHQVTLVRYAEETGADGRRRYRAVIEVPQEDRQRQSRQD